LSVSPYLRVEEVGARYQARPKTVREWARNGAIPHFRAPGARRLQFRLDWLEAWEQGCDLEVVDLGRGGRVVRPTEIRASGVSDPARGRASTTHLRGPQAPAKEDAAYLTATRRRTSLGTDVPLPLPEGLPR
jgi:hypothetical protein